MVHEFGSEGAKLSVRQGGGWSSGEGAGVSMRGELWLGLTQQDIMPHDQLGTGIALEEARTGTAVPLASLLAALHCGWRTQGDGNALLAAPTILPSTFSGSHLRMGGACPPSLLGGAHWPFLSTWTFSVQVHTGFGRHRAVLFLPAPPTLRWPLQAWKPPSTHYCIME